MGAINAERQAPAVVSNVFPFTPGAEGFSMRRKQLKQTINSIQERWATYRAPQDDMPALVRQPVDDSQEAQAKRFEFMAKHIASVESSIHNTTVWLRVPTSVGNPFGLGAEFSGRTLTHAVDAAMNYINLSK
jgi:hypothetical protein